LTQQRIKYNAHHSISKFNKRKTVYGCPLIRKNKARKKRKKERDLHNIVSLGAHADQVEGRHGTASPDGDEEGDQLS
jgi:hypothetical protein